MNFTHPYQCVLLIDDDDTSLYLTEMAITRNKFAKHIHSKTNASEALEFIEKNCNKLEMKNAELCPELIFLDINMPGLDGFDFLDMYNKFAETIFNQIKIFMLTSSENSKDVEKAKLKGVSGYIVKPLTSEKISNLIHAN